MSTSTAVAATKVVPPLKRTLTVKLGVPATSFVAEAVVPLMVISAPVSLETTLYSSTTARVSGASQVTVAAPGGSAVSDLYFHFSYHYIFEIAHGIRHFSFRIVATATGRECYGCFFFSFHTTRRNRCVNIYQLICIPVKQRKR